MWVNIYLMLFNFQFFYNLYKLLVGSLKEEREVRGTPEVLDPRYFQPGGPRYLCTR